MIISAPRQKLLNGQIHLQQWLLAPLFLNNAVRLFYALEKTEGSASSVEMIVTTIEPKYWHDVWRLEIETQDKPGNLLYLLRILKEQKIDVLGCETSVRTFSNYHPMSFVISAANYVNDRDKDVWYRYKQDRAKLDGLELLLKLNFADQIAFSDHGYPRVKIRRLDLFRRLHVDMELRKSFSTSNVCRLQDHRFKLEPKMATYIRKKIGDDVFYTLSAVSTVETNLLS